MEKENEKQFLTSVKIKGDNVKVWKGLDNGTSAVNLLLELASTMDHPNDVCSFLRKQIKKQQPNPSEEGQGSA